MYRITRARRARLAAVLARISDYDVRSIRIAPNGEISACFDPARAVAGHPTGREYVGFIDQILGQYAHITTS